MSLLIASSIFSWIAIVCMACIIYALTRQIGILYERLAPAGALAVNQVIEVGDEAPIVGVKSLQGSVRTIGGIPADGRAKLLLFLSPDCPVCKTLLPAVLSMAAHEFDWLDTILCSDGNEQDHRMFIEEHDLKDLPYVLSELLGKSFGVAKLPYSVLIDNEGNIAAMGIVNSREHLDSLFQARELGVTSIQDYMQRKNIAAEQ